MPTPLSISAAAELRVRELFAGNSDGVMPSMHEFDAVLTTMNLSPQARIQKKIFAQQVHAAALRKLREAYKPPVQDPVGVKFGVHTTDLPKITASAGGHMTALDGRRTPQASDYGFGGIRKLSDLLAADRPGQGMHILASGARVHSSEVDRKLQWYRVWPPENPDGTLSQHQTDRLMSAFDPHGRDGIGRKMLRADLEACGRLPRTA